MAKTKNKKQITAPLRRTLKKGSKGQDVAMIKRALSSWEKRRDIGPYTGNPNPVYGDAVATRVKRFQKAQDLKADGQYGSRTHKQLLRFFDAYGAQKMRKFQPRGGLSDKRAKVVEYAMHGYHNCGPNYSQVAALRCQGYYNKIRPPKEWDWADCSGYCLWCYWGAGVTGVGPYDGWTGSMVEYGKVVSRSAAKPGDSAFYGSGWSNTTHMAMIVSVKDGRIKITTHGHAPGPQLTELDYRSDLVGIRSYIN